MERIQELKLGVKPEAAVSGAVLLQSEYSSFLTFNAQKETDEPSPYGGFYTTDAGTAIVEFKGCLVSKFGHPNDEAAAGIPKYRELEVAYGICEVMNSTWVRELEEDNNHSFPNTDYSSFRHFLIFFHDSTFECIAKDIMLSLSEQPYSEIINELGSRIAAE
ncbi:MAG: hypothetical protein N0E58_21430 [Candidatus Thiodiazotropha endolucinida]|uniref:Uncharacterized protein n=1 Tax=Candidatus Thiodiazotropha taylori TaxID=2792791 RepID=A0A9E4NQA5_9GAMM|nr:hypothetical protein [Candidatus Thiodiazotropha taylori]MCW4238815.1 hypothetical protein [Candidatus Thiodiazotropha endolucinida]